jgi:hypothetical protein
MSTLNDTPEALRAEAGERRRLARIYRAGAEFADGPAHHRDLAEARRLDTEAAGLERRAAELETEQQEAAA